MEYLLGIFIGIGIGSILAFIKSNKKAASIKSNKSLEVSPYLRRIGELRVFRAYFKEIVTSVDHIWGDIGKKYFSWIISEKKLAIVFEFEVDFVYDLQSQDLKVVENPNGLMITMPKCKYDVKIKDFYFYDEQNTRIKLFPEILSSIFEGGSNEEKKNELIQMAIKQVEEISKQVAEKLQFEVHNVTKETLNNLFAGLNRKILNLSFKEMNIIDEQINIENPKLLEEKLN